MNIQELQTERLDINNKYNVELVCKQFDDVILKIIVYDKSLPADLSNYNVRLKAFKADQVPLIQNTNITIKDNTVVIKASKQLTTTSGIIKAELQFINKTTLEKKSTFYLNIEVVASVLMDKNVISTPTCTLLEELDNKLDEIENIGNILDEAKEVRDTLQNTTIPTGTTLKSNLDKNIIDGTTLKTDLTDLIPKAEKSKIDLDESKTNADLSNAALLETTNNAEIKKQEVISECKVADEKIKQMNEFRDVTEVVKDVTLLKTEVNTARDNETDLNTRLERDKTNILKTIGNVNVETDGDIASQLKDMGKNLSQLSNPSLLINGDFQIAQRGTNFDITHNRIYTLDRWVAGSDDGKVRVTNLSNGGMQIETLEAGNIVVGQHWLASELDLRGKTITASISIDTSKPLMLHIYAKKSIGDWSDIVYKTISQNGIVSVTGTIPNDCERFNIEVNGTGFAPGDIEKFNWAKLELGSVATQNVPRPYGEELALCQRYFQRQSFAGNVIGEGNGCNNLAIESTYVTPMRIKPTITLPRGSLFHHNICKDVQFTISSANTTPEYIQNIVSKEGLLIGGQNYSGVFEMDAEIY